MQKVLLDTNILIALIRDRTLEERFKQVYTDQDNLFAISVVVQGELESLALQWNWGERKKQELNRVLGTLIIIPIKVKSIINAYAKIDAYSQGKLADVPYPSHFSSKNMGKNDLWIAATAYATGSKLLTLDHDFDHLQPGYLVIENPF
jgi:predicted nucleic acid-binding protein